MVYDLKPVHTPVTSGALLKTLVALAESRITGPLLAKKMLRDVGIVDFRNLPTDDHHPGTPPDQPHVGTQTQNEPTEPPLSAAKALPNATLPEGSFCFHTAGDYVRAYTEKRQSPSDVAEALLARTTESDQLEPAMRFFIAQRDDDVRAQAEESTQRYARGEALGPLDGVPIAVKDELDQAGYPTTVGTRFLGTEDASDDADVVARLRQAGAVLVGKANMHEIGMGVTGYNHHHGTPRNPYNPSHATGGSSSGSAAIVGAGLCPIAIGADGGGSIRIPASLCGGYGIKATFGRMSERGAAPLCWSLAHVGPIAASARDLALAYAVMAGPDPHDANSLRQPPPTLDGIQESDLTGLRIGIFDPWFDDADETIVTATRGLLDRLCAAGATLVPIEIPELSVVRSAHLVTIATEIAAAQSQVFAAHRKDYGPDIRLKLALAHRLTGSDYVHAQRHRVRLTHHFLRVLQSVDVIATPMTGSTAPAWSPKALVAGESNLGLATHIMKYALPANLTGLPAISVPAGYDESGLPIGLQWIGRHWEEHTLFRLALVAEAHIVRQAPRVHLSPLT
jgi:Asp-tRNA(Asn)/Glu-tRNA(Gln) amidotransferase A subunit family amidase